MIIICNQCGEEFYFSKKEQRFYDMKGYVLPKRCPECRKYAYNENLGYKTSSFFHNSQILGMPANVSGGLDIKHNPVLSVEVKNKILYIKIVEERIFFTKNIYYASVMTDQQISDIKKQLSNIKGIKNSKKVYVSHYVSCQY